MDINQLREYFFDLGRRYITFAGCDGSKVEGYVGSTLDDGMLFLPKIRIWDDVKNGWGDGIRLVRQSSTLTTSHTSWFINEWKIMEDIIWKLLGLT